MQKQPKTRQSKAMQSNARQCRPKRRRAKQTKHKVMQSSAKQSNTNQRKAKKETQKKAKRTRASTKEKQKPSDLQCFLSYAGAVSGIGSSDSCVRIGVWSWWVQACLEVVACTGGGDSEGRGLALISEPELPKPKTPLVVVCNLF